MLHEKYITRLLDIANAACHRGQVADARIIYSSVLELKPDFLPAKLGLAFSHIVLDEFEPAEGILQEVLSANPNDADAKVLLGLKYFLADDKAKASEILEPLASSNQFAADLMAAV